MYAFAIKLKAWKKRLQMENVNLKCDRFEGFWYEAFRLEQYFIQVVKFVKNKHSKSKH